MKFVLITLILMSTVGAAQACVSVVPDDNFSQNRRVFLVNTCGAQVEIINTNSNTIAYILSPGERGIAFSGWSWQYR